MENLPFGVLVAIGLLALLVSGGSSSGKASSSAPAKSPEELEAEAMRRLRTESIDAILARYTAGELTKEARDQLLAHATMGPAPRRRTGT